MKKLSKAIIILTVLLMVFAFRIAYNNYKTIDTMSSLTTYHNIEYITGKEFAKAYSSAVQPSFALWKEEKNKETKDATSNRTSKVALISYIGNTRMILPIPSTLEARDYVGCLIDKETAIKLFGSTNAKGCKVKLANKEYIVRDVFEGPMDTMIITVDENTPLNILTVQDSQSQKLTLASDLAVEFTVYKNLVKIIIFVAVLIITGYIVGFLFKKRRQIKNMPVQRYTFNAAIYAVIAGCIISSLYILPKEILPNKWSDFGYWNDQVATFKSFFMDYYTLSKTRQIVFVSSFLTDIITAFIFFVIGIIVVDGLIKRLGLGKKN